MIWRRRRAGGAGAVEAAHGRRFAGHPGDRAGFSAAGGGAFSAHDSAAAHFRAALPGDDEGRARRAAHDLGGVAAAGYEPLEFTRHAPIHKTIGVGQIYQSEQVANGNYNLLLRGVGRATIVEELTERDYRLARVTPVQTYCHSSQTQVDQLREELFAAIRGNRALDPDVRRHWLRLAEADLDLDDVCDLIAAGLPVEAELRQCLLDEPEAAARTQMLIDHMRTLAAIARNYWRPMRPDGNSMN
jgi:hypothetical protein